jgi:hypothetical protein
VLCSTVPSTCGWRLEANLNRETNGLASEGVFVGLYEPLLDFNLQATSTSPGNQNSHNGDLLAALKRHDNRESSDRRSSRKIREV